MLGSAAHRSSVAAAARRRKLFGVSSALGVLLLAACCTWCAACKVFTGFVWQCLHFVGACNVWCCRMLLTLLNAG
jgi:hypothetical protein